MKNNVYSFLWFVLLTLMMFPVSIMGQDVEAEYANTLKLWRQAAVDASIAAGEFQLAKRAEADAIKKRWKQFVVEGDKQLEKLKPLALQLLAQQEKPDPKLYQLVMRIMEDHLASGNFTDATKLMDLLQSKTAPNPQASTRLEISLAELLILTNRFDEAIALKTKNPGLLASLDENEDSTRLYYEVESLRDNYRKELEIQASEKEADDLPRVEVKTTKGSFVIELFENEAPDTVGNFIYLIEKCRPAGAITDDGSAYDGMIFHRVIDKFMAQTGGRNAEGKRAQIGWTIYDECEKPEARLHFRGSVSMAKTTAPNSGNSQFFITFIPTPGLNNRHTVFGRIVSGMESVDRLNRTHFINDKGEENEIEGAVRDQILSVRILRKREHEYKPNMVK